MIRAVSIIAAAAVLTPAGVLAADYKTTCSRGADARIIEVVAPGEVGQSCDVRYTRSADNVSVPYHADNSDAFCNEKARALAQRLASAGFTCASSPAGLRAEAQEEAEPQIDYVVEAQRAASAEEATPETPTIEQPAELAAAAEPEEQETSAPRPVALEPVSLAQSADEDEDALEEEMDRILEQPSEDASSDGPTPLAPQTSETPQAAPQSSPVDRLTGADPDAPQAAAPASAASPSTAAETAPEDEAEENEPAPAANREEALRTPAEIIRATLLAQAAAWNDGDLDGFMEGYWKSDDLKFVSGVDITRGWSSTMKRYRDRYAGGDGLGRLNFENMESELVTDDVAVVTGRFNHLKDGESSNGVFTLVMRRDNGAWRIVHDHTSADPSSE